MRNRYLLALGLVFIASLGSCFAGYRMLRVQERYAALINLSGRQRMLSQKTALLVLEAASSDSSLEKRSLLRKLDEAITLFATSHDVLKRDAERGELPKSLSQTLALLYASGLDSSIRTQIIALRRLQSELSSISPSRSVSKADGRRIVSAAMDLVLPLDKVVLAYEQASRSGVDFLMRIKTLALLATLVLLFLEYRLIFLPLSKTTVAVVRSLESATEESDNGSERKEKKTGNWKLIRSDALSGA